MRVRPPLQPEKPDRLRCQYAPASSSRIPAAEGQSAPAIESEPGRGSTFTIRVPRIAEAGMAPNRHAVCCGAVGLLLALTRRADARQQCRMTEVQQTHSLA